MQTSTVHIYKKRLVRLVSCFDGSVSHIYTGDFGLSSPILARSLAWTSGQIQHWLNAATCPLLAGLLLAHLKPLYLANCKQRHAFAQYKSCYAVPSAGRSLILRRCCAYTGHTKMLILTEQMLANFCYVPTSFLWIIACFWSTLTAYTLPSILCLARRTLPKLPFPITFKKSKSLGRALHKEMKHYHK